MATTVDRSMAGLLRRLAAGWNDSHPGPALELVQAWREAFRTWAEVKEHGDGSLYFVSDLSEIHLRGTDDVHVLVLARGGEAGQAVFEGFRRRATSPGRLLVVLAFTSDAARAMDGSGRGLCLILEPDEVRTLLEGAARERFKSFLHRKVPLRTLIPYNYLRPALGNLFFGRQAELHRLIQEEEVSWAVAGPGRIGKTSLLKEYHRRLVRARDPRLSRVVEIDFYPCGDTSAQGVARFFAMNTESSSRSHRMTPEGLVDFLRHQRAERGGPLELLLDEVDEVCHSVAFDRIGEAAKLGLCRLVLCGRGELLGMMLSQSAPLACRLELLRPSPLEDAEARDLVVRPLTDLGLTVENPELLMDRLFRLTGRLPHLLQLYGKSLAEQAIDQETRRISPSVIESLGWDFEIAQYITSPLAELKDPEERVLALSLLLELSGETTVHAVQALATRNGLSLSQQRTLDILNRLVIANILSWRRGRFYLANEALRSYAEVLGFLDNGLEEAQAALRAGCTESAS